MTENKPKNTKNLRPQTGHPNWLQPSSLSAGVERPKGSDSHGHSKILHAKPPLRFVNSASVSAEMIPSGSQAIPREPQALPKRLPWSLFGVPRVLKGIPRSLEGVPRAPEGVPRHSATKTSKLAKAFVKNWRDRAQSSSASTIFIWKCDGHNILPAFTSARTPKCKHCLRN